MKNLVVDALRKSWAIVGSKTQRHAIILLLLAPVGSLLEVASIGALYPVIEAAMSSDISSASGVTRKVISIIKALSPDQSYELLFLIFSLSIDLFYQDSQFYEGYKIYLASF